MAWNGSGTFNRLYSWVSDAAASIKIRADRMDAEFNNFKTGLQNCLTLTGETLPTANIPMNSKKFTGLAAGTANGDSVRYEQLMQAAYRKNLLKNGAFNVWQSGAPGVTPVAGTAFRTADCWWCVRASVANYYCEAVTGTIAKRGLKVHRNSATSDTQTIYVCQSLESQDVSWMKNSPRPTLTFSAYLNSGANFSGTNVKMEIWAGSGTDEQLASSYTGATLVATVDCALTIYPTLYSCSGEVPATTNEIAVRFSWTPSGTAGAADEYYIQCAQLEVGSTPSPFEYRGYAQDLMDCQRYYFRTWNYIDCGQTIASGAYTITATSVVGNVQMLSIPIPFQMAHNTGAHGYEDMRFEVYRSTDAAAGYVYNVPRATSTNTVFKYWGANSYNTPMLGITLPASTAVGDQLAFGYELYNMKF